MLNDSCLVYLLAQAKSTGYAVSVDENDGRLILTVGVLRAQVNSTQATSLLRAMLQEPHRADRFKRSPERAAYQAVGM